MDWGFDTSHPISLKPDKRVYALRERGCAMSVILLPGRRAARELLDRREAMLSELPDCPQLNLPRNQRLVPLKRGCALIEEMLLSSGDGPDSRWEPELIEGLRALHGAGWAHLDLKPEHLLWADGHWRLHDLDGCRRIGERIYRRDITYAYAPPEALWRDRVHAGDDLYAAALMLYRRRNEGRLPFERGSERRATLARWLAPNVPVPDAWGAGEREFFHRALRRAPSGRYRTTREFIEAWSNLTTR